MTITGCHPNLTPSELAVAVSTQCAPVTDLLSKNVKRTGELRVVGQAIGGEYTREGAVLESAAAQQTHQLDAACRAWVSGAMSDEAYTDFMVAQMGGAISLSTRLEDQQAAIRALGESLGDLRSGLPGRIPDAAEIAAAVQRYNAAPASTVSSALGNTVAGSAAADDALPLVVARLDYLEQLLERPGQTASASDAAVIDNWNGFEVYFATNSAELTFESAQQIEARSIALLRNNVSVIVTGYADARGSAETNTRLSAARAKVVADLLAQAGVRIRDQTAFGSEHSDPNGYSRARRVTVRYDRRD